MTTRPPTLAPKTRTPETARADVIAAVHQLNHRYDLRLAIPDRGCYDATFNRLLTLCCAGKLDAILDKFDCVARANPQTQTQPPPAPAEAPISSRFRAQTDAEQPPLRTLLDSLLNSHCRQGLARKSLSDGNFVSRSNAASAPLAASSSWAPYLQPRKHPPAEGLSDWDILAKRTKTNSLDKVQNRESLRPAPVSAASSPLPSSSRSRNSRGAQSFGENYESMCTSRASIAASVFSHTDQDPGGTQTTVEASQLEQPPGSKVEALAAPQVQAVSYRNKVSGRACSVPLDQDAAGRFPVQCNPASDEDVKEDAALATRLGLVWPKLPIWLRPAPLAVAWEVTRIALHCNVNLDGVENLLYDSSWDNMTTLRSVLYKHPSFQGHSFPEQCSAGAWAEAVSSFKNVLLAAEMDVNTDPDPSGPFFHLKLQPLKIEQSYRLSRKFGEHRFLEVLYPSPCTFNKLASAQAMNKWLSTDRHEFLGRRWAAFFTKDAGYRQPATSIQLGPDQKQVLKERVYFFAESGPNPLASGHSGSDVGACMSPVTLLDMLTWHLQLNLEENQSQPWPKLFSRIQLGLTRTHPTVTFEPHQIREKEDDLKSPAGNVMNDGVGLMSRNVAKQIQQILGLEETPRAVQGRFGSAKGMWMIDPFDDSGTDWIETYPSQRKWKCTSMDVHHRTLEIKRHAGELRSASLNLQFLPVLHNRSRQKDKMRDAVSNLLRTKLQTELDSLKHALNSPEQFLQWVFENASHRGLRFGDAAGAVPRLGGLPERDEDIMSEMLAAGFDPKSQKFLQELAFKIQKQKCETLKEKLAITVNKSTNVYMVVDFWNLLEENEIHMCFSNKFDSGDGFSDTLLTGVDVLVARSPAHYISDIQKVKAVFRPELKDLKDVVVFSAKGDVALAEKLSGGDYDGDIAWLCWESEMVDNFENAAVPETPDLFRMGYLDKISEKTKDLVQRYGLEAGTTKMIEKSFEFNMQQSFLGICTNFKERLCYRQCSVENASAVLLSTLVSNLVDQAKQGIIFTRESWVRLQQELWPGPGLRSPLYKENSWQGASQPKHIIDYIKFAVAKPMVDKSLGEFHESIGGSSLYVWDPDLVQLFNQYNAMESLAIKKLLEGLRADLNRVERLWRKSMSTTKVQDGTGARSRGNYRSKLEEVYGEWAAIQPDVSRHRALPGSRTVAMLTSAWLDPDETEWAQLRASATFKWYYNTNSTFVWRMAGAQLMRLKAKSAGSSLAMVRRMHAFLKPNKKTIDRFVAMQQGNESMYEADCDRGDGDDEVTTDYGGDDLFDEL